jgi:hypothetical protein
MAEEKGKLSDQIENYRPQPQSLEPPNNDKHTFRVQGYLRKC